MASPKVSNQTSSNQTPAVSPAGQHLVVMILQQADSGTWYFAPNQWKTSQLLGFKTKDSYKARAVINANQKKLPKGTPSAVLMEAGFDPSVEGLSVGDTVHYNISTDQLEPISG